jgi:hypothetical protein
MVAILKVVGIMSCGFLLCLGLSNVASSADKMSDTGSNKTIKGKLLRIEGENYFVKNREDGKELRLHVDNTTIKNAVGYIDGANIIADITDQNHAILILTDQSASTIRRDNILKDLQMPE